MSAHDSTKRIIGGGAEAVWHGIAQAIAGTAAPLRIAIMPSLAVTGFRLAVQPSPAAQSLLASIAEKGLSIVKAGVPFQIRIMPSLSVMRPGLSPGILPKAWPLIQSLDAARERAADLVRSLALR